MRKYRAVLCVIGATGELFLTGEHPAIALDAAPFTARPKRLELLLYCEAAGIEVEVAEALVEGNAVNLGALHRAHMVVAFCAVHCYISGAIRDYLASGG